MKVKINSLLPDRFKQIFIILAAGSYVLTVLMTLWLIVHVYSTRPVRVSQFMVVMVTSMLLPLVFFAIGLAVYGKKRRQLDRIFAATIIATVGVIVEIAALHLQSRSTFFPITNTWTTWGSLVSTTITLIIIALGVYCVRRHKFVSLQITRLVASVVLLGGFLMTGGGSLYDTLRYTLRTDGNTTISNQTIYYCSFVIMALIACITILLITRRASWLTRLYVGALLTTAGGFIWLIIAEFCDYGIRLKFITPDSTSAVMSWIIFGLGALGYISLVVWYKQRKNLGK